MKHSHSLLGLLLGASSSVFALANAGPDPNPVPVPFVDSHAARVFGGRIAPRDINKRQKTQLDVCGVNFVACDNIYCCPSGNVCDLRTDGWYCVPVPTTV